MGWIGSDRELLTFLEVVKCDRDEEGLFIVRGQGITSFLGAGQEFVINDAAEYRRGDKWYGIAGGLRGTSYGLGITVI